MPKTSTEWQRHALNGHTMGTHWSALFHTAPGFDAKGIRDALQSAVDDVDAQMSTWKPDSALMQLNAAPTEEWVKVPRRLMEVLHLALDVGRTSDGAFEIGMGDAVNAWGFGSAIADQNLIRRAHDAARCSTYKTLELDLEVGRVRKTAPVTLDLNGIAKGYGVDCLTETLRGFDIPSGLLGIDGEMRAIGQRPDGEPWAIAIEAPERNRRSPHSILTLQDASVATSGDYRHWVTTGDRCFSHTMNPHCGAPLIKPPASVTVMAPTCAKADAWATALMVLGPVAGGALAHRLRLDALFLLRNADGTIRSEPIGTVFEGSAAP